MIAQSHQEPEVRRVALEQLVLRIRALPVYRQSGTSAAEVCSRLLVGCCRLRAPGLTAVDPAGAFNA